MAMNNKVIAIVVIMVVAVIAFIIAIIGYEYQKESNIQWWVWFLFFLSLILILVALIVYVMWYEPYRSSSSVIKRAPDWQWNTEFHYERGVDCGNVQPLQQPPLQQRQVYCPSPYSQLIYPPGSSPAVQTMQYMQCAEYAIR